MSRKKSGSNLKFAAVFFILVAALIFISLSFRFIFLLRETKFDGSSHFTLLVKNISKNKTQLISFSPKISTIGILTLDGVDPKTLEIPVDAEIKSDQFITGKNLNSSLFKILFDFKDQSQVNFIDIFRFLFFSETIRDSSISEKIISLQTEKIKTDSIISTFFTDSQIIDEKENIEIINATGVFGLGNRLANYVSNMGVNVILVSSADERKQSEIQYSKKTYTVKKLSSILSFRTSEVEKKSLPDVIIIIGTESLRDLKF